MNIIHKPAPEQKLNLLGKLAQLDCDGEPALNGKQQRRQDFLKDSIALVQTPTGSKTVLRTLQTSACEKDCHYCPFRAGRSDTVRLSFAPEELAAQFNKMEQAKAVDGLFLSSGIIGGGIKAMDKTLATVEILRKKYQYRGYIHLKVMPGAEQAQVEQAVKLADRISINLEGANSARLAYLAPQKNLLNELLPAMQHFRRLTDNLSPLLKKPGLATQFVVGPAGETDRELLTGVDWLYRRVNLSRAYYSAFRPVANTPLENAAPTSAQREHRLYQADWLLRFYGFKLNELPFTEDGALPTHIDPKLAWARQNLAHTPLEINSASYEQLLRIPGIGPAGAKTILQLRNEQPFYDLSQFKKAGIVAHRASPFVLINGKRPPQQLQLF